MLATAPRLFRLIAMQAAIGMRQRLITLTAVLAFALFGGWPAHACGWWDCRDGYGPRQPTRVYGYYKSVRPSAPIRVPSRLELLSAPPIPNGNSGLLITPGAMPGPGPSLFGPPPPPAYYYSAPSVRKWQRRSR
jgi:hypothetical protein